eukprot:12125678-Karenia_brevis.AAC.1
MDGRVPMMNRSPGGKRKVGQERPRHGEPGSTAPNGQGKRAWPTREAGEESERHTRGTEGERGDTTINTGSHRQENPRTFALIKA